MSKFSWASNQAKLKTCRFDMFLSFRGSNTRKNFTDHLLKELKQHGYRPFHDSILSRGEYIDSELLKAIEESRMSIILFSKNYADSKWCLDELVKIMFCRENSQQIVLPVFLDVEPSDVRNQVGGFAQAFQNHEDFMDDHRVNNWRMALKDAAKLSGLHLQNDANGYESKLVDKVIKEVSKKLKQPCLNVAYHPVGIESRMTDLIQLLQLETNDVRIVSVWGVGGLGKTTIAKATYNSIFSEFESSSFLEDIKDSEKTNLQNKLLADLVTDKAPRVNNVYQATEEIRRILKYQRVLLVLDDINHFQQLEMLAIDRRFFCPGSRIIITTRDIASIGSLKTDAIYSPEALSELESLTLFNLYAFEKGDSHKGYEMFTKEGVQYASGIPLVLKTIGSSCFKLSKPEWQDYLRKLKKVPNDDIQGKLKISFDSLDYEEKELFLNISCFFIGMEKKLMVNVLTDSNCFPEIGIKKLVNRALVNIDDGMLSMHNLIRDMGREIVRQESLKEPGKRSRLWDHDDISQVFQQCSGTSAVESIIHGNHNNFIPLEAVNIAAFENMTNLKMLLLDHVPLYGTCTRMHFSAKLKYLQWHGFPLNRLSPKLNMRDLVVMDMRSSKLKILWEGTVRMDKLQFLNLSYSCLLTKTPDFSGMKNLQTLLLGWCSKLVELHRSVTCLDQLCTLDLSYCVRLKNTPDILSILKLKSIKELYMYHCPKLKNKDCPIDSRSMNGSLLTKLSLVQCNLLEAPTEIGRLESLVTLELQENVFSSLPALRNLNKLKQLNLSDCVRLKSIPELPRNVVMVIAVNCINLRTLPSNMSELQCLEELKLSDCKILGSEDPFCLMKLTGLGSLSYLKMDNCNVVHVPGEIGNLASLNYLDLGGNKFSSLPASLGNLHLLLDLNLSNCIELQTVPDLPRNLVTFKATNCINLISMPSNISDLKSLRELHLDGCSKLGYEDPFCFGKLEGLSSLVYLNMKCCNLSHIPYGIDRLVCLGRLDLSGNIMSSLPASLSNLQNLKELDLNNCVALKSFPVLPPDFTVVKADYCRSLETLPFKSFFLHGSSQELRFSHCPDWAGEHYAQNFMRYIIRFHHEIFQFQQVWPTIPEVRVSLSGTEIPDWCTYRGSDKFLSFVVPENVDEKFSGWIYCAIAPNCKDDECRLKCRVVNKTKGRADYIGSTLCGYGPMFLAFVPHLIDLIPSLTFMVEGGDEMVLVFELESENNWKVEKCGLCLIYEGDDSIIGSNCQTVVEYTPADLRQQLHQLVYEQKWEEYKEIYQIYINSKGDDDDSDSAAADSHNASDDDDSDSGFADADACNGTGDSESDSGAADSHDVVVREDGGSAEDIGGADYDRPSSGLRDDGPWYLLSLVELRDWLHDPVGFES